MMRALARHGEPVELAGEPHREVADIDHLLNLAFGSSTMVLPTSRETRSPRHLLLPAQFLRYVQYGLTPHGSGHSGPKPTLTPGRAPSSPRSCGEMPWPRGPVSRRLWAKHWEGCPLPQGQPSVHRKCRGAGRRDREATQRGSEPPHAERRRRILSLARCPVEHPTLYMSIPMAPSSSAYGCGFWWAQ